MPRQPRTAGFSLVELLVVIAILGLLMGLVLPAVQAVRESARRATCGNNMRQIGLAVAHVHDHRNHYPAGWAGGANDDAPGWGWAVHLLPQLEEQGLYDAIDRATPIFNPADISVNAAVRNRKLALFLCPSDVRGPTETSGVFGIDADHGHDDHDHHDHEEGETDDHATEVHPVDGGDAGVLCELGKSNYIGSFGAAADVEAAPAAGDGIFFRNSRIGTKHVHDGLSRTIFVGERNSRLGCSTWVGVVAGAEAARSRVVGVADHVPNSGGHFEDYSSEHGKGANFLFGDSSTRFLGADVDATVFKALGTRSGGEAVEVP
jgi:prepilin-type N-terminal cleavage/methylation domain-containing protein